MSHHKRKDLGIEQIVSTGRMVFESADPDNEWSSHSHMEHLVTSEFEEQSFSKKVSLEVDDSTFNVLQIRASVEHIDQFNEAVDWTLEFMKSRSWLVETLM